MQRSPLWLAVALALVVSACSRSAADEPTTTTAAATTSSTTTTRPTTTTTSTTTTTTTTPTGPVSPLNGLPAEDPELLERGVLAVKIDNHFRARPQSGLQDADAVYELPVEGVTRFIALFHDNDSPYLGPIRSVRPTDPTLVNPVDAAFAISGGSHWILRYVAGRGTQMIGEGNGMFRIRTRSAPHNLYGDTTALREEALRRDYRDDPPTDDLFPWGAFQAEEQADTVRLSWGDGLVVNWEWDGKAYLRFIGDEPHGWVDQEEEEGQISADTLVVLFASRYRARPPRSSDGTAVPAMDTVGSGRVLVFAEGGVAEGTWSRDEIDEPFSLTGPDGETLHVPPGMPWISVFPDTRSVTW